MTVFMPLDIVRAGSIILVYLEAQNEESIPHGKKRIVPHSSLAQRVVPSV